MIPNKVMSTNYTHSVNVLEEAADHPYDSLSHTGQSYDEEHHSETP